MFLSQFGAWIPSGGDMFQCSYAASGGRAGMCNMPVGFFGTAGGVNTVLLHLGDAWGCARCQLVSLARGYVLI